MDLKTMMKAESAKIDHEKEKGQISRMQQAWQDWWGEKKKNNCLLLEACKVDNIDLCKQLLNVNKRDLKADVNYKGENGWTPFHFACLNGNNELVNLLLYHEADIDAHTALKFTSLHIAAQKGHSEIVQLLINSGADFNSRDIFNNTPLHYAAQHGKIYKTIKDNLYNILFCDISLYTFLIFLSNLNRPYKYSKNTFEQTKHGFEHQK